MKVLLTLFPLIALSPLVSGAKLKGASCCIVETDGTFAVRCSGSYCGAGSSVTFSGSGKADVTTQCFNPANNQPQGKPLHKSYPLDLNNCIIPLDPNGCVDFCVTTTSVSADQSACPPPMTNEIESFSVPSFTLTGSNLPRDSTFKNLGTCTKECTGSGCQ